MHSTGNKYVDYPTDRSSIHVCSLWHVQVALHYTFRTTSIRPAAPSFLGAIEAHELYEIKHPRGLKISSHTVAEPFEMHVVIPHGIPKI